MSKNGKPIQLNPDLRKAISTILAEDNKIDQDKLVERIKEKKIPGLPEGVIRIGVKNYLSANPRSTNSDNKPAT